MRRPSDRQTLKSLDRLADLIGVQPLIPPAAARAMLSIVDRQRASLRDSIALVEALRLRRGKQSK